VPRQSRRVPANYYGTHFGGIDVVENTIHTGVDGRRYSSFTAIIFDLVVPERALARPSRRQGYDFAIQMNRLVNFFRRAFGVPLLVAVAMGKQKVKNAVNYIGAFRKDAGRRSPPPRRRRLICRPHPLRRDPRR